MLQKEPKANKAPESFKKKPEACTTLNSMQKSASKIPNMQCLQAAAPYPPGPPPLGFQLRREMDPSRPICRATEGAGLGRREGPTGWNPLPPAGATGRKKEGKSRSHPFPPQQTLPFYPVYSRPIFVHLDYSNHFLLTDFTTSSLVSSNPSITATILIFLKLRV